MRPRRSLTLAVACLLSAGLLAACGSGQTDSTVTGAAPGSAAPSADAATDAPWTVIPCSGEAPAYGSDVSEGDLGTDDVQVANVGGSPTVSVKAGAGPVSELQVVDIIDGTGTEVAAGGSVAVNYCGIGLTTRTMFDSSYSRGAPVTFPLDGVIPGFAQGLVGMKTGGQRLIIMPGVLGYGENPPPGIEPDESLVFVVDLVATQ